MDTILKFLHEWTTLHTSVEITYVINGYEVLVTYDGNDYKGPFFFFFFFGKTIEEAIEVAERGVKNAT